jgi:hypothetical protein
LLITRVELAGALIVKLPLASVAVAVEEPFTVTVAPATAALPMTLTGNWLLSENGKRKKT